jgi:hypothetical protein
MAAVDNAEAVEAARPERHLLAGSTSLERSPASVRRTSLDVPSPASSLSRSSSKRAMTSVSRRPDAMASGGMRRPVACAARPR